MQGVSVVICCYNSALRLPETLRHLSKQIVSSSIRWEVLIVNNNSTDSTASVAQAEWKSYKLAIPLRIVDETKPGLSAAREKGIGEALYDYLLFCDDDNWLAEDYVNNVYGLLAGNATLAAVGGNNTGAYEVTPPAWMNFFGNSYAIGKQGNGEFEILEGTRYLVGAGMAFKREAYQAIKQKGFGFYLTDRIGNKVVGGGDVELCFIFKLAGYSIAYSANLNLQHYMPAGRITEAYLVKMWHQYSYSWLVFEAYKLLLTGSKIAVDEAYWKKVARQRLLEKAPFLLRYIKSKVKGDLIFYLPYEVELMYNVYLLRNTDKLMELINELRSKVGYE
ncbi:glycosyltransferase [Hymenobacter cavernae]|uniref:Glycosyltransferase 2-like domain-containing protein n=1 Tax=Hymenobacter cavernae TaxID=2044852 RepID=A0ABQ1UJK8_9BACT|nr:glycosyltransferase [Hymenobacter cavernae]GGF20550.1 hypothetical protein GCM10011383_35240 [Hymenobacter cavernae]